MNELDIFKNKTILRIHNSEEDSRITSLVSIKELPFKYFICTNYLFLVDRWPTAEEFQETIKENKSRNISNLYINFIIPTPKNISLSIVYTRTKHISLKFHPETDITTILTYFIV